MNDHKTGIVTRTVLANELMTTFVNCIVFVNRHKTDIVNLCSSCDRSQD